MEDKITRERADAMMEQGFHCSQCVFPYAASRLGMDTAQALKLSAGLGGGCFHGDSCGAVTGGVMALGMVYGFDSPNAEEADALLVEKVQEFTARFQEKTGALLCRQLLNGFDKSDPDAVAPEGTYDNCAAYCAQACAILDEMIGDRYIK